MTVLWNHSHKKKLSERGKGVNALKWIWRSKERWCMQQVCDTKKLHKHIKKYGLNQIISDMFIKAIHVLMQKGLLYKKRCCFYNYHTLKCLCSCGCVRPIQCQLFFRLSMLTIGNRITRLHNWFQFLIFSLL